MTLVRDAKREIILLEHCPLSLTNEFSFAVNILLAIQLMSTLPQTRQKFLSSHLSD